MPKFLCRCRTVIDRTTIPNKDEWLVINEAVFDRTFQGTVDSDILCSKTERMPKCPGCGRLWVFWERGRPAVAYRFEGEEGELEADGSR